MPAATDKFKKVGNPGTATTLSAPGYTVGATSLTVASTTNHPTDTGVCVSMYEVTTVGTQTVMTPGSYNEYNGVVSGATSITSLSHVAGSGTDRNYAAGTGTVVTIMVSSGRENDLVDGLLVEHGQDGKHTAITATSVVSTGAISGTTINGTTATVTSLVNSGDTQHKGTSLDTLRSEIQFDYVASGCQWVGDAYGTNRNASMTAGVVYISGIRATVSVINARTFTASKDTYCDVGVDGVVDYTEVANNAASPVLAAGHIRLAIVICNATVIPNVMGAVNWGQERAVLPVVSSTYLTVTDSLGNLICPRDPSRRILGYRQIISTFSTASASFVQVTGVSVPVIVPTGRKVKITAYSSGASNSSAGLYAISSIWRGVVASGVQLQGSTNLNPSATREINMTMAAIDSDGGSGSLTYNLGLEQSGGGTASLLATATTPTFLMVELV